MVNSKEKWGLPPPSIFLIWRGEQSHQKGFLNKQIFSTEKTDINVVCWYTDLKNAEFQEYKATILSFGIYENGSENARNSDIVYASINCFPFSYFLCYLSLNSRKCLKTNKMNSFSECRIGKQTDIAANFK